MESLIFWQMAVGEVVNVKSAELLSRYTGRVLVRAILIHRDDDTRLRLGRALTHILPHRAQNG